MFERYVNFEFYKRVETHYDPMLSLRDMYILNSTNDSYSELYSYDVWEICKFWILQTVSEAERIQTSFERYVNFVIIL